MSLYACFASFSVIPNISVKPGLVGQVCNPALRRQKGMDRIHGQRELYRRSCLKETKKHSRKSKPCTDVSEMHFMGIIFKSRIKRSRCVKNRSGFGQVVELMQQELSVVK